MKLIVALALVTASFAAQAVVTKPETIAFYENGMAEARDQVARAKTTKDLQKLLKQYRFNSTRYCTVSYYLQSAADYVLIAPSEAVRKFTWTLATGSDTVRRQYKVPGNSVQQGAELANNAIVAVFQETNSAYKGEYGACTMAVHQIQLVEQKMVQLTNGSIVVQQPNGQELPVTIIEPGDDKH